VELVLLIKDRVFPPTRWISRTISLGVVPSVIRVRVYTTFCPVLVVHLLIPVPIIVIV
jgi:hypothetical protein